MSAYLARLKTITGKNGEKPLLHELPKLPKGVFDSFGSYPGRGFPRNDGAKPDPFGSFGSSEGGGFSGIDGPPQPNEVDLEESAAIAIDGGVPAVYADAWARLQCQKPLWVSDGEWRQAIAAAGRFLDQWGSLAVDFQWTAGDLFDVPGNGKPGGLIWFLGSEAVRSLGLEYAATDGGRVFDRIERGDWINPFQKRK